MFGVMPSVAVTRIPLNLFAIPLGLTGLAETWSDAGVSLIFPLALTEVFWAIAAIAWVWMIAAHLARGARSEATLASQLRHPAQGPTAAIVPIVGMLLGANLHQFWPVGGTILVLASIVATALFASWILSFWMRGELALESVHGAYLLPTVAASFVAGGTASVIGAPVLGLGAFAVGAFSWLTMFPLVAARLTFRAPLPAPLAPTMAILMAPPAVAGLSWFAYNGGKLDVVEQGLAGVGVLLVLMQLQFLRRYVRLPFSLGFWTFAFPTAFVGAYAIVLIEKSHVGGAPIYAAVILALVTGLIVAIAIFSLRLVMRGRGGAATSGAPASASEPAEQVANADASIEPANTNPS
jgi:tellurite resistance protein